ncbi:SAM-dependent MidA family methyltransferase [Evansella vedderi]|uniref:SAM-dependent MidA family methyltransferase n=1 Tax=Evansella vedderi TaxID=38282 RepID=A0ABT9ZUM5_9BACI|nr:SAM-dependent methyltransferase [Evansella vedderi]MDQ0254427.1 SAM-dependent MidA family methyltransferase [Evansella vedderi]
MDAIKLRKKLERRSAAPWSYSDFMEYALYDDEFGYYSRESIKLGKEGDFYTSNHVHPVFQQTFARFFTDTLVKEELTPLICEQGAGDGRFARNVVEYIKNTDEELYSHLNYIIIETSAFHRKRIKEVIAPFEGKVSIFSSLDEARDVYPVFEGIIFSNELIDAFPVHVVEKKNDALMEVKVKWGKDEFIEEVVQNENSELENWLNNYGPKLPEGHRLEICLPMREWLRYMGEWLQKGLIVTVDYGYSNEELVEEVRREGSLRGYYKHEMIRSPLKYPGEMDITAHVQWDAFRMIGKEMNLSEIFHDRQDIFLLKAGLFTFLKKVTDLNPFSENFKQNRAIQSLVHPGGISSTFHVNIQGKELDKTDEYGIFTEDPYQTEKYK